MKLAFIAPTQFLDKYSSEGDCYLALAHLIDDNAQNDYARFHRAEADKGATVICDNGLFEGAQVETESLLRRAKAINASVVCAPDVLYDSQGTIKQFKAFVRAKQDLGFQCDVMGIPQASNAHDWWECFRFMDLSSECQLIGLSILSVPQSFEDMARRSKLYPGEWKRITNSRLYLLRQLVSYESLIDRRLTPCHMLGLGESLADIIYANRVLPSVVSNDSSSAFVHGIRGIKYTRLGNIPGGKIHEKIRFDSETDLSEDQTHAISWNISIAKRLAHMQWAGKENVQWSSMDIEL